MGRSIAGLSRDAWQRFRTRRLLKSDILLPGYKCNMPDPAAALGIHQLRKQERFLEFRERYARRYDEAFTSLPVRRQPRPTDLFHNRHSLHLYTLQLDPACWRVDRDQVIDALLAENIGAALHYRAIHTHSYYRQRYRFRPEDYPHAYAIGEQVISLPLTPAMSQADVDDVVNAEYKLAHHYTRRGDSAVAPRETCSAS
jgi:dTDP-4-amino-4,6-dideoxygalactose transaminase